MFSTIRLPNFRRPCRPRSCRAYVVVMAVLVAGGTLFDIVHKKSAKYFFDNWRNSKNKAQAAGRWRER